MSSSCHPHVVIIVVAVVVVVVVVVVDFFVVVTVMLSRINKLKKPDKLEKIKDDDEKKFRKKS